MAKTLNDLLNQWPVDQEAPPQIPFAPPADPQPAEGPQRDVASDTPDAATSMPVPVAASVAPTAMSNQSSASTGYSASGASGNAPNEATNDVLSKYQNLLDQRDAALQSSRKNEVLQKLVSGLTSNVGLLAAGQAGRHGNTVTAPHVNGPQTHDISSGVESQFKPGLESLMERYKQLQANARNDKDAESTQAYRNAMLGLQKQTLENKQETRQSEGEKATDRDYAKDYNDWTSTGRTELDKNLTRLKGAKEALSKSDNLTGNFVGRLPDVVRPEDSIALQQDVQSAAIGGLRAALGAQFTENEGKRIMDMSYDPKLSEAANKKKIDTAIEELQRRKEAQDSKSSYFENNKSLSGFKSTPKGDFGQPSNVDSKIESFMKKNGITDKNKAIEILKKAGKI